MDKKRLMSTKAGKTGVGRDREQQVVTSLAASAQEVQKLSTTSIARKEKTAAHANARGRVARRSDSITISLIWTSKRRIMAVFPSNTVKVQCMRVTREWSITDQKTSTKYTWIQPIRKLLIQTHSFTTAITGVGLKLVLVANLRRPNTSSVNEDYKRRSAEFPQCRIRKD